MIPEFTVSPKLLENMLSIRVAEVLVILVGYVMFGNNEFAVMGGGGGEPLVLILQAVV